MEFEASRNVELQLISGETEGFSHGEQDHFQVCAGEPRSPPICRVHIADPSFPATNLHATFRKVKDKIKKAYPLRWHIPYDV
jgi:hypothetical protein